MKLKRRAEGTPVRLLHRSTQGRLVQEPPRALRDFACPYGPSSAVLRRARVVHIPAVFRPLPDITQHIGETKRTERKAADRRGLFPVPLTAATIAIGSIIADRIAPPSRCARASARSVFHSASLGSRYEAPVSASCSFLFSQAM